MRSNHERSLNRHFKPKSSLYPVESWKGHMDTSSLRCHSAMSLVAVLWMVEKNLSFNHCAVGESRPSMQTYTSNPGAKNHAIMICKLFDSRGIIGPLTLPQPFASPTSLPCPVLRSMCEQYLVDEEHHTSPSQQLMAFTQQLNLQRTTQKELPRCQAL